MNNNKIKKNNEKNNENIDENMNENMNENIDENMNENIDKNMDENEKDFTNDNKAVKQYIEHINSNDGFLYLFKILFLDYFYQNKTLTIIFIIFGLTLWGLKIFIFDNIVSDLTMLITKNQSIKIIIKSVIILLATKFFIDFIESIIENIVDNIIPDYNSYIRNIAIHHLYYKFYDNLNITISYSTFLQILFDLCYHLRHIMLYFLDEFIIVIFALIIKLFFIYSINVKLFYITLVSLIICIYLIYYYSVDIIKNSTMRSNAINKINKKIHNNFENLINIYVNNKTNDEIKDTQSLEKKFNISYKKQLKSITEFSRNIRAFFTVLFAIIISTSLYLYKNKEITAKKFISILIISNTYFIFLSENFSSIPTTFLVPFGTLNNFYNILIFLFSDNIMKFYPNKYPDYIDKRNINHM
jgi:ABC-type multidrug transport system fused ATPase/permease subunit